MTADETKPWEQLFPPPAPGAPVESLPFNLASKGGEPLLLLPIRAEAARHALALYPAQTLTARTARRLLELALRLGLRAGTRAVQISLDAQAPFPRFLRATANTPPELKFAMLLGNPRAAGRRFLLLLLDDANAPLRIVKAGVGEAAVALIRREAQFLKSAPANVIQSPALTGEFAGAGIEALALEYCAGSTPSADDRTSLVRLLENWLNTQRTTAFTELPAARRLAAYASPNPLVRRVLASLETPRFRPAIFHGDFAPWNVRVRPTDGRWMVLDWERGELSGPPTWDWFHFLIQNEILVHHTPPPRLAARLDALTCSAEFARYAERAGVRECVSSLLLAYLLYCCHVQRQAEGMAQLEALLALLAALRLS